MSIMGLKKQLPSSKLGNDNNSSTGEVFDNVSIESLDGRTTREYPSIADFKVIPCSADSGSLMTYKSIVILSSMISYLKNSKTSRDLK